MTMPMSAPEVTTMAPMISAVRLPQTMPYQISYWPLVVPIK
jgi:hypothetical protein